MKIGIVEPDVVFRERLARALEEHESVTSVFQWGSGEEFWRDAAGRGLQTIFLNVRNGAGPGSLAFMIAEREPEMRMVMLFDSPEDQIDGALRLGAIGFVLKDELDDAAGAVDIIAGGRGLISPSLAIRILQSLAQLSRASAELRGLTGRERQVLDELAVGMSPAEIARTLNISINTIRFHIRNLYKKLDVSNRHQLAGRIKSLGL